MSRRPRRPSRTKVAPLVWIAGGCAAGALGVVVLAAVDYLIYRVSRSTAPEPRAGGVLQTASRDDRAPQAKGNERAQAPEQQPQPPDFQPPNDPPFDGVPPGNGQPPPNNRPPGRGQKWPVVLSNGRVGTAIGLRRSFTISYRFEQGGPALGQHYFVVIKSPSGSGEAHITPLRMAKEGTFHLQELGFGARDNGPFEAHLETGMPGPFGPREVVSNTIKLSP